MNAKIANFALIAISRTIASNAKNARTVISVRDLKNANTAAIVNAVYHAKIVRNVLHA